MGNPADPASTSKNGGVNLTSNQTSSGDDVVAPPDSTTFTPTAAPAPQQAAPLPAAPNWRFWLLAAFIVLALGGMYLWARANPQAESSSASRPRAEIVQPMPVNPNQTLNLTWRVVTAGPSPFNSTVWVARIELGATGGNGEYIFWVNGQRLPEMSNNQFTVESQGCQPVSQFVGVTSDGRLARQELVIYPPEPSLCSK